MGGYLQDLAPELLDRARRIQLLSLDVDGILTDGSLLLSEQGETLKAFNTLDGLGIKLLRRSGVEVALITGRQSPIVSDRARALGIELVYQHCEDKWRAAGELRQTLALEAEQTAHMGDDLPDLTAMVSCGLAITVPNAHPALIERAHYCTARAGGRGAVREVCDLILHARGQLEPAIEEYLRCHA